ncbi:hypothetical protein [Micromonospora yangpuensis]|uniref:Endonuclease III n=1 Tax=Micromonospora yangpuensis TaxID=683228 RepID=A0A1C6UQK1_9ACTN|nr:hypothetical protein [Micromonospora yangpuensis]GGM07537.1 endonuclease [Micromonospora yangpuensis]SCL56334.1 hypothetical protein GA0070617_3210 [Micromonospora yangpuensis]
MTDPHRTARALLDRHGRTFADDAGITLTDRPAPLYQLLVLTTLLSTRIRASLAVSAARHLFAAGYRTPHAMAAASWSDRVDALGAAHYRRYDERTATMLGTAATHCQQRWHGDLRRLHADTGADRTALRRALTEFPGIGPTGADIFLREAQSVWPDLRPFLDRRALAGARRLGLPTSAPQLAHLVAPADLGRLASALVRVTLDEKAATDISRQATA